MLELIHYLEQIDTTILLFSMACTVNYSITLWFGEQPIHMGSILCSVHLRDD